MTEGAISKKEASETRIVEEKEQSDSGAWIDIVSRVNKYVAEGIQPSSVWQSHLLHSYFVYSLGHKMQEQKELEKRSREERLLYYAVLRALHKFYSSQYLLRNEVERRLAQLERKTSIYSSALGELESRVGLLSSEEHWEQGQWPEFASEEFEKIDENGKNLEEAGEDKSLRLYHIMEIETLLGKVEKKARATNREYEARLAASLRDICRIHEPSELSDEQIKCFTGSLQALIEGWGELNREKVKWVRGRLLEVGLTWLPVTEKARRVIDEAKSSVR